jgi:hypothetical protein
MIKAKHTPGPWLAIGNTICTDRKDEIAEIIRYGAWYGGNTPYGAANPIGDANAQLIAAAPDLLLALEAIACEADQDMPAEFRTDSFRGALDAAFDAINKARGETL